MAKHDDDESIDTTFAELDTMKTQVDEMMATNLEKMNAVFKKSVIYAILWSVVALAVSLIWPKDWYFWVPTVIAGVCIVSVAIIFALRIKMNKMMADV